jgi:hypothetical protein
MNDKDDENLQELEENDRAYQDNLQKMYDMNGELFDKSLKDTVANQDAKEIKKAKLNQKI